jgi:hypothetical protein
MRGKKLKKVLILWSGGLDSTSLLRTALEDPKVEAETIYIKGVVSQFKEERELKAISGLSRIFSEKYRKFPVNYVEINGRSIGGGSFILSQPAYWIFGIVHFENIAHFDEVWIGYVMNDCAISFLREIRNLYLSYNGLLDDDHKLPKLVFPLIKKPKLDLLFDGGLTDEIINACTFCENDAFTDNCGECPPCMNRKMLETMHSRLFTCSPKIARFKSQDSDLVCPEDKTEPGYALEEITKAVKEVVNRTSEKEEDESIEPV